MKLIVIFTIVMFLIGAGIATVFLGIVNVPGISPTKYGKPVEASPDATGGLFWTLTEPLHQLGIQADAAAKTAAANPAPVTKEPPPSPRPEQGDLKLAAYWNGVDVDQLAKITEAWQPSAVAKVLLKMDEDQVTKYLNQLKPPRADQISRAIQALASQPKSPAPAP